MQKVLNPIVISPKAYVHVVIAMLLVLTYAVGEFIFTESSSPWKWTEYNTIDEMINEVKRYQGCKDHQSVIDILKQANIDKLVLTESKRKKTKIHNHRWIFSNCTRS